MRTRDGSDSKKRNQPSGGESTMTTRNLRSQSHLEAHNESGTLADISKDAVGKLVRRVNSRGSSGSKKKDNYSQQCDSTAMPASGSKMNEKQDVGKRVTWNDVDGEGCSRDAMAENSMEINGERIQDGGEELDDSDWEDGSTPVANSIDNNPESRVNGITVEFDAAGSAKKKPIRRASAEDKELAELVHKVHVLCLLARGRLIDCACDDPLIQASLLSLLPTYLFKVSEEKKLTVKALSPIVHWFHDNFRVGSSVNDRKSVHSALAHALESREGTPEEIAALSVALFRALKLTARFVSILDVVSLKPEVDKNESSSQDGSRTSGGIFSNPTLMVSRPADVTSPTKTFSCEKNDHVCESPSRGSLKCKERGLTSRTTRSKKSLLADDLNDKVPDSVSSETHNNISQECITKDSQGAKRKGDVEFEMQLQMALAATSVGTSEHNLETDAKNSGSNSSTLLRSLKRTKRIERVEPAASSQGISTAVGSRKVGSPLYWAEVYCSGENLTGKWVHVDAANAIIDGEQKVEAAAAACKTSLRYVVAFAGRGAKDVTRRYCMQWYKIAPRRVNSVWWDAVLAPLRELESAGITHLEDNHVSTETGLLRSSGFPNQEHTILPGKSSLNVESTSKSSTLSTLSSIEDMELETRALTEPLPTNQQAYKNHPLYAIERWLNKHQILYPKGPVLGFCSGHPVYPRTCVQTLKTKNRWLREALQVKANEFPVKVIKNSAKLRKEQVFEAEDYNVDDSKGNIELYGKWQLEPLLLPHAVDGIVPKNERGQVDVWSEKCLPHGTVHLRLPRVFAIAKKLEIDYAPAMVGFEFRSGRATPVYDGIVVCSEFKDIILEGYAQEEEKREAEERKRREAQALSRWYQLLSSIVTRQKLNNRYADDLFTQNSSDIQNKSNYKNSVQIGRNKEDKQSEPREQLDSTHDVSMGNPSVASLDEHVHVYLMEDQSFDEESSIRTKRCHCGFSIQVEEL